VKTTYPNQLDYAEVDKGTPTKRRGDAGIEPATSCTQSRNHTTRPITLLLCVSDRTRHRVRVVKEVDSKSTGLCPREFESRRCRFFFSLCHVDVGCKLSQSQRSPFVCVKGDWSSGMIPASGAGGREFDSRITPFFCEPDTVSEWLRR
jgi:hypothetical protein